MSKSSKTDRKMQTNLSLCRSTRKLVKTMAKQDRVTVSSFVERMVRTEAKKAGLL